MKSKLYIFIPLIALVCFSLLQACKKEEKPSHVATISNPVVTLVGNADTTISRGAVWKDPGATWTDSVTGESGTLTAQAVNTSIDSAYVLVYTATNKNGFQTVITRGLGVTNIGNAADISGGYTANGEPVTLTKVARGLYSLSDGDGFGGGDSTVLVMKSDSSISIATIQTLITGTVGAPIPETFTGTQVLYQPAFVYTGNPPRLTAQPAVIIQYNATILNVPPVAVQLVQNLQ